MRQLYFIPCTIERGGFSSERTFKIDTKDGAMVGTADVDHLCDAEKKPLGEDEPPPGETIEGFVKCRLIRISDGVALVDLPSDDVVHVPSDCLQELAAC